MELDPNACYRAARARDRRFDGRFYRGDHLDAYLLPADLHRAARRTAKICVFIRMRRPRKAQVSGHASAAGRNGLREWLRSMRSAAWSAPPWRESKNMRLSSARVGDLAASLGISDRHLRRVTETELGVSPIELAQTQRLLLAKRLLRRNPLEPDRHRFCQRLRQRAPLQCLVQIALWLESARGARQIDRHGYPACVNLNFRPPLAWNSMLVYLRLRAIPGVEMADATHYRRTVAVGAAKGWIAVSMHKKRQRAECGDLTFVDAGHRRRHRPGEAIVRSGRSSRCGQHAAGPGQAACRHGAAAPWTAGRRAHSTDSSWRSEPCWDNRYRSKERAPLPDAGPRAFGESIATPFLELNRLSPGAERMAEVAADDIAALGMVGARARCLAVLAQAVARRANHLELRTQCRRADRDV